jgi:dTDP-4-dehydrorhamnose reductase
MRIAITGATGNVGTALLRTPRPGLSVLAQRRFVEGTATGGRKR